MYSSPRYVGLTLILGDAEGNVEGDMLMPGDTEGFMLTLGDIEGFVLVSGEIDGSALEFGDGLLLVFGLTLIEDDVPDGDAEVRAVGDDPSQDATVSTISATARKRTSLRFILYLPQNDYWKYIYNTQGIMSGKKQTHSYTFGFTGVTIFVF